MTAEELQYEEYEEAQPPAPVALPESPFSLTWRMQDGYGCDVQITMRHGVNREVIAEVMGNRKAFLDLAQKAGWQVNAAKPAPTTAPAAPANGHAATPAAAQPATPPPSAVAGGGFASAASESFDAETLEGSVMSGKAYWKVKGGQFTKFGVTVWPEVLANAGLSVEAGQVYDVRGWRATFVRKPDGKPDKVIRMEKVG